MANGVISTYSGTVSTTYETAQWLKEVVDLLTQPGEVEGITILRSWRPAELTVSLRVHGEPSTVVAPIIAKLHALIEPATETAASATRAAHGLVLLP